MRCRRWGTLPPLSLEARHEGLSVLSNRSCSSAAFCCRPYTWFSPVRSHMGRRYASWLNAVNPLCRGWLLGRRVLSIRGGISVAARWPYGRDLGGHARHCVGSCSLLCCHYGCELELPLCPPYRIFDRDYSVFDRGGMAFGEASLKPFVRVCSSPPGEARPYSAFWRFLPHCCRIVG